LSTGRWVRATAISRVAGNVGIGISRQPGLRGRYLASMGLSWWLGLAIAPVLGIQLLSASPTAAFLTAAVVALGAGASALMVERALPESSRLTPRPSAEHPSPESERRTS
jgi:hypothetical protein